MLLLSGLLSFLSPCVLPLVPIVFGTAAGEAKGGPFALAAGVALSFTAIGLFVATLGFAIGLDGEAFRTAAAILMIGVGVMLMAPGLQTRLAVAGGPVTAWADERINAVPSRGLLGQFGVGLLLGAAWSPCVGPTLGAASVLAAQGVVARPRDADHARVRDRRRGAADRPRPRLAAGHGALARPPSLGGKRAKTALGVLMIALGLMIVTGADRTLETAVLDRSPQWLTDLTTRF